MITDSLTDRTLLGKLDCIQKYVEKFIDTVGGQPHNPNFTAHGRTHLKNVMNHVSMLTEDLMKTDKKLNQHEIFILCSAVWLHDIGMLVRKKGESHEDIRKIHHIRSEEFINENKADLNLLEDWLHILVGKVAKGHRKVNLYSDEYDEGFRGGETIRVRLLSAILRMADELDVDQTRAPNEVRVALGADFTTENLFHWVKHKYVQGVGKTVSESDFRKNLCIYIHTSLPKKQYSEKIIRPFVISPISEEYKEIAHILNETGIYLVIREKPKIDVNIEELTPEESDKFDMYGRYNSFIRSEEGMAADEMLNKIGSNEFERNIILFTAWNGNPIWKGEVGEVYCKIEKKEILTYPLISEKGFGDGIKFLKAKDLVVDDLDEMLNFKKLCDYIAKEIQNIEKIGLEKYLETNPTAKTFIQKLYDKTYFSPVEGITMDPYNPEYRAAKIIERANEESPIKELRVQAYSYENNIKEIFPILWSLVKQETKMRFLLLNPISSDCIRADEDIYKIAKNAKLIMSLEKNENLSIKFYDGNREHEELLFRGHIIDKRIISFATWPFHITRIKYVDEIIEKPKLGDPRHGARITYLKGHEINTLLLYQNYFDNIWNSDKKPTYQDLEELIKVYFEKRLDIDDFVEAMRNERRDIIEKWGLDNNMYKKHLEMLINGIRNDQEDLWYDEVRIHLK